MVKIQKVFILIKQDFIILTMNICSVMRKTCSAVGLFSLKCNYDYIVRASSFVITSKYNDLVVCIQCCVMVTRPQGSTGRNLPLSWINCVILPPTSAAPRCRRVARLGAAVCTARPPEAESIFSSPRRNKACRREEAGGPLESGRRFTNQSSIGHTLDTLHASLALLQFGHLAATFSRSLEAKTGVVSFTSATFHSWAQSGPG